MVRTGVLFVVCCLSPLNNFLRKLLDLWSEYRRNWGECKRFFVQFSFLVMIPRIPSDLPHPIQLLQEYE